MNATIGVNRTGPITGMCCKKASGATWVMATTDDGTAGTSAVVTVFVAAASGRWGEIAAWVSRRDAAASISVTGESAGAAGSSVTVRVAVAVAVARGVIIA